MSKRHVNRTVRVISAGAAMLLALSACGGDSKGDAAGGEKKEVNFGVIEGWTDETSTTAVMKVILEQNGYKVKITQIADNAPMYTALAKGDIDVLSSSWLERNHKSYWAKYGKDIADLGVYYNDAQNYLAVPTYSDIQTIDDLKGKAAQFDNRVIGIEPGAGLTLATQKVLPDYGLDDYKLVLSSTAAMLAELKKSTAAKKPIVVTLWKPFWANQAFPVRALKDTKGVYGPPEKLHVVASKEFATANPAVAKMLSSFKLNDKQYGTLEDTVVNKFAKGKEDDAAKAWLAANPGYGEALTKALKS